MDGSTQTTCPIEAMELNKAHQTPNTKACSLAGQTTARAANQGRADNKCHAKRGRSNRVSTTVSNEARQAQPDSTTCPMKLNNAQTTLKQRSTREGWRRCHNSSQLKSMIRQITRKSSGAKQNLGKQSSATMFHEQETCCLPRWYAFTMFHGRNSNATVFTAETQTTSVFTCLVAFTIVVGKRIDATKKKR